MGRPGRLVSQGLAAQSLVLAQREPPILHLSPAIALATVGFGCQLEYIVFVRILEWEPKDEVAPDFFGMPLVLFHGRLTRLGMFPIVSRVVPTLLGFVVRLRFGLIGRGDVFSRGRRQDFGKIWKSSCPIERREMRLDLCQWEWHDQVRCDECQCQAAISARHLLPFERGRPSRYPRKAIKAHVRSSLRNTLISSSPFMASP